MALKARFAELGEALIGREGVTLGAGRTGFGSDTLQVDGRIFAMLSGGRLVLKLPQERVAALVASGDGLPFDGGKTRPMKEWVALPDDRDYGWLSLAEEAMTFVGRR